MSEILLTYCGVTGLVFLAAIMSRAMAYRKTDRKWLARFILTVPFWPVWIVAGLYFWVKELLEDAK